MLQQATARSATSEPAARSEREAALRERLFALGRLQTLVAHEIRQIRRELARSGGGVAGGRTARQSSEWEGHARKAGGKA